MMPVTVQEWIVAIIVLLCTIEIVRRAIRFFRSTKRNDDPCGDCAGRCDMKRMLDNKQQKYKESQKKGNKKCCG